MANLDIPSVNFSPIPDNTSIAIEKENITPHTAMKTGVKLNFSPFSKSTGSKNKSFKILSDDEVALVDKSCVGNKVKPMKLRRSLATLQPSIDGSLTGQSTPIKDIFLNKKQKFIHDTSSHESNELVDKALSLMKATENADEIYWETIAEERRLALEETLSENEKLYGDIDKLKEENAQLKKELNDVICYKLLYENLIELK